MRASLLVAAREYGENARTKGFWIGLFIFPVLLLAVVEIPRLLEERATPVRHVAIVDESDGWGDVVRRAVEEDRDLTPTELALAAASVAMGGAPSPTTDEDEPEEDEPPRERFRVVPVPDGVDPENDETLRRTAGPFLTGERRIEVDGEPVELFALVVLRRNVGWRDGARRVVGVEYWSTNFAADDLEDLVASSLAEEYRSREYAAVLRSDVDEAEVERIQRVRTTLRRKDPSKAVGEESVGGIDVVRQWAPLGFVYILFVSIFTVSQMLLNGTIEEKSNRIVEVLFSSITAWELMLGKLLGVAGIGLTMLVAWFATGWLVLVTVAGIEHDTLTLILSLVFSSELLVPFVVYFVLGYLLYAAAFLAIGSTCNTIKESQNYMGPVMVVSMVPLFTMAFIPKDPNGPLAVALSWVPPWTPFVMMNRAAASPPTFDLVGTTVLLVASVVAAIWLAGRVFRANILRTGEPPRLVELIRSVKG